SSSSLRARPTNRSPREASLRKRGLVAARAATSSAFWGLPFLDLEGVPAAARCGDVGIVDREAGLKALHPIDLRACQVRRAERVDHDVDAVHVELVVALGRSPIEAERVLEAGAAAALNGDPQNRRLALRLLGHQLADLVRRARGERDESWLLDRCHGRIVAAPSAGTSPSNSRTL